MKPHVSFPEFQQNGSAKQFANGTKSTSMLSSHHQSHHSDSDLRYFSDTTDSGHYYISTKKKIKKYRRKSSHGHNKYRRLELGKSYRNSRLMIAHFLILCCHNYNLFESLNTACAITAYKFLLVC